MSCRPMEQWRFAGMPVDEIAERLGRHRSTIYREIKRNYFEDKETPMWNGYFCIVANDRAKNVP